MGIFNGMLTWPWQERPKDNTV